MKLPRRDLIEHWHLFIEENLWFDAGRMWNILLVSMRINWHLMLLLFRLPSLWGRSPGGGSLVPTVSPPPSLRMPGLYLGFHLSSLLMSALAAVAAQRDLERLQWGRTLLSSHLPTNHLHLHHQDNIAITRWESERCQESSSEDLLIKLNK